MNLPRVTYLIAHRNYEEFLGSCLESALAQTYPNIHICVIDDYSDGCDGSIIGDNPLSLVMSKYLNPENITSIDTKDYMQITNSEKMTLICCIDRAHGPSYARNRGIEHMWDKTDIFAVLDADDENYPTKISTCVEPFIQYPEEMGVVYADVNILNTTTGVMRREYKEPYDLYRLQRECIVHSGSLISKKALAATKEDTGYYDETMRTCEDYDLWMRISENFIIQHVPKALTLVRVQPKNSTDTVAKEIWERNWQKVHLKAQSRR